VVVGRREEEENGGVELNFRAAGCREGEEYGGALGDLSDWLHQSSVSCFFSPKIMCDISSKGDVTFRVGYNDAAKATFVVFDCLMK
jgi:hypothetical protein